MNLLESAKTYKKRSKEIAKLVDECQLFIFGSSANAARNYIDDRIPTDIQREWEVGFFHENYLLFGSDIFGLEYWYWKIVQNDDCRIEVPVSILAHHPIVFPYRDQWGSYVGLCGRTHLTKEEQSVLKVSKYKYTRDLDKSHFCYGLNRAKESIRKMGFCCVVEGQIDTITCHRFGLTNTVGLGGSSLSPHQFRQIRMWTDRIVMLTDPDAAGVAGLKKTIQQFCEDASILHVNLPEGSDIDSILVDDSSRGGWIETIRTTGRK
jgi:DNA primase